MAASLSSTTAFCSLKPFDSHARRLPRQSRQDLRTSATAGQDNPTYISRRQAAMGALVGAVSLLQNSQASAFLGIGEPSKEDIYKEDTATILKDVGAALSLDKSDPAKEEAMNNVRKETNAWVAKYRRDNKFAGRPSYGNTYSALNALAGHFNSFGPTAPLPKKRLERIQKELEDANRMLGRGR
ncbi:g3561 [Coccomyxa elongata]